MRHSQHKAIRKTSLRAALCRPHLENLEDRWLPGDTLLSGLLAQAMLSTASGLVNISSMGGGGNTLIQAAPPLFGRVTGPSHPLGTEHSPAESGRRLATAPRSTAPTTPVSAGENAGVISNDFDLFTGWAALDDLANLSLAAPAHTGRHGPEVSLSPPPAAATSADGTIPISAPPQTLNLVAATPMATGTSSPSDKDLLTAIAVSQLGSPGSRSAPSPNPAPASVPLVAAQTAVPPAPAAVAGGLGGAGGSGPEVHNDRETLTVPTTSAVGVNSRTILQAGVTYTLVATGKFRYGTVFSDQADAQYHHFDAPTPYAADGVTPLGLEITGVQISGTFPRWGSYQRSHVYSLQVVGRGQPLHAYYRDSVAAYGTHQGTLQLTLQQPPLCSPPVPPTPPCDSCTNSGDLVGTASGANGGYTASQAYSESGVRYFDGTLRLDTNDLTSSGFGVPWGEDRTFSNLFTCPEPGPSAFGGPGWATSQQPYMLRTPFQGGDKTAEVVIISSSTNYHAFAEYNNGQSYVAEGFLKETMTGLVGSLHIFTDSTGKQFTFYGFNNSPLDGQLMQLTDPAQNTISLTYNSSSQLTRVQHTAGPDLPTAVPEQYFYDYTSGYLTKVRYQRMQTGSMTWTTERQVEYVYYNSSQQGGNVGDLLYAKIEAVDPNSQQVTVLDQKYYRYYAPGDSTGNGYMSGLKYVFNPQSYARLTAVLNGTDPTTLTDTQFSSSYAGYADDYFQYNDLQYVSQAVIQGAGCSSCNGGLGTYSYTYTANTNSGHMPGYNSWEVETTETLPDGNTNLVYTNKYGQIMLKVFQAGGQQWETYYQYDTSNRTIKIASPSALTGFDPNHDDLVDRYDPTTLTWIPYGYLKTNAGLIQDNDFYASGGAAGYLLDTQLQQGWNGMPIIQQSMDYVVPPAGGNAVFVAHRTVYRDGNPADLSEQTAYTYTWYTNTVQPSSMTVTKPLITAAQNGPDGTANDQETTYYDALGRVTQTQDADGYVNTYQYDAGSGGLVQFAQDVNHLNLVTTYTVDGLGRETSMTQPNQAPYPVSTTYIVYNDPIHEVRTYPGWHYDAGKAAWLTTGPTQLTRDDRSTATIYDETLTMTAPPALDMNNHPTGTEAISQVQSLSRDLTNNAGQVVEHDAYVDLGPGYSYTATIAGAHVNATLYGYDERGRPERVVSANGTIQRTVYDGLSRVVSTWIGTNDSTPDGMDWSPQDNVPPANMIQVTGNVYDSGQVGDGNLTQTTHYPHGTSDTANPPRVTNIYYDWRDRAVYTKEGAQASEDNTTHRPITYVTYDNLDEVTNTQRYDGDGIYLVVYGSNGVPIAPGANLLRAQTNTAYDNQGRVYQSSTYSVDTSGNLSAAALVTNNWYNHRGALVKTSAPGGLVQKMTYDGAGRETFVATTDGKGDGTINPPWSDAQQINSTNTVLTETQTQYDGDNNPVFVTTWDRYHNAAYTGDLSLPHTPQAERVSFDGKFYDAADRLTNEVNYGNNHNNPLSSRPTSPAARGADPMNPVLRTDYTYLADTVQTVALSGNPTGNFTLSFGGQTTVAIDVMATAATVQMDLQNLNPAIGANNVLVYGPAGGPWNVRFTGKFAGQDEPLLTANGSGLMNGSVSVARASQGGDAGRVQTVTDPRGLATQTDYDLLGRTLRTVAAFTNNPLFSNPNWNQVTEYAYDGDDHVVLLTAYPAAGSIQQTQYTYAANPADATWVSSKDQLTLVQYPDKTSGRPSTLPSDQESYLYNNLGETRTKTERTGTQHNYSFDVLSRPTLDSVSSFGTNVDPTVGVLGVAYDTYGNAATFTSYAPNGTTILNQVQRTFNGLGQLTVETQYHGDPGNMMTPRGTVSYTYSGPATGMNYSRLVSMTYPSGRQLDYSYGNGNDTLDNTISRLTAITDHSTGIVLETYIDGSNAYADYLGLSTVVQRDHPQAGLNLTYIGTPGGDANDLYVGLDRFGRVVDQNWQGPMGSTDRFQYGYDFDGNRLYQANLVTEGLRMPFDELYHASGSVDTYVSGQLQSAGYDVLNQMTSFSRGTLSTDHTSISNVSHAQNWMLDGLGNWTQFNSDSTNQNRTTNQQNELTAINSTNLGYDNNGNTTTDDYGHVLKYDAWNRLVSVSSGMTAIAGYAYDALGRRIQEIETNSFGDAVTRDLYFSDQWQVLEEHESGTNYTNLVRAQYVWSPVYVDALVERDRDPVRNGSGMLSERFYVQQDANWNVTSLVDTTGTVQERFIYDPYGKPTDANGRNVGALNANWTTKTGGDSYGWVYLHQGGRYDASTGLYYFRNRDYSPTLGRWMEVDPIGFKAEDNNLYRYEHDDPATQNDALGLKTCGPDVTDWFKKEIELFYKAAKEILKDYKEELNIADLTAADPFGGRAAAASMRLVAFRHLLEKYKRLGRLADYKSRNEKNVEPFDYSKCPDADRDTVSLCGKCITTNQLGNFIFGIIAAGADQIANSRAFGRGDLKRWAGKPSEDWRKAPWKEAAFDLGVDFAELWSRSGSFPDLCKYINTNAKAGGLTKGAEHLTCCNAKHTGPNTDMSRNPLTNASGNK